jgi:hypothetical protein
MKDTCKKIEAGEYEYKGRRICRTDSHAHAYAPWRVSGNRGFRTLAEAKLFIDTLPEVRESESGE